MFLEVIMAEDSEGYRLGLLGNNGERRIVDLSNSLKGKSHWWQDKVNKNP